MMNVRYLAYSMLLSLAAGCGGGDKTSDDASLDASEDATASGCVSESDGTPCGLGQICLGGSCETSVCGDGFVDPMRSEECDDGNFTDGDGCDNDCTYSCHDDADCDDEDVCTGIEACIDVPNGKTCQLGTPLDCDGGDSCKVYTCDPVDGCGVEDLVTCYRDQDGDGYPLLSNSTPAVECGCPLGYITKRPDDRWDCNDRTANARPGQTEYFEKPHCANGSEASWELIGSGGMFLFTWVCNDGSAWSFDYNCDGVATQRYTRTSAVCNLIHFDGKTYCIGDGWSGSTVPACGTDANFLSCFGTGSCSSSVDPRTQECR
jgi:cysteine-rich repeat protein